PEVLEIGRTDQVLAPGDDAGGRAAQELVRAVDGEVRALGEEALEVVFGRRVDDHRDAAGVADLAEGRKRDLAVVDAVVRDDVERRRRALVERAVQMVRRRPGGLPDRAYDGAGQPDRLLDRGAVVNHVPLLDRHHVAHARRVRQLLDPREVGP